MQSAGDRPHPLPLGLLTGLAFESVGVLTEAKWVMGS